MRRKWPLLLLLAFAALLAFGAREAAAPPIVRTLTMKLRHWPQGKKPVQLLLIADLHVSWPDMPPRRLHDTLVELMRARPDIVVIAGDVTSQAKLFAWNVPVEQAAPALRALSAPLGVYAVYGNHDHAESIVRTRRALIRAGVRPLANEAVRAGPLTLGGVDDPSSGHQDIERTVKAMRALGGVKVLVSHTGGPLPWLPADVPLLLAGHSHCGQWAIARVLLHARCGISRSGTRLLVTTAGLGTSILPLRYGAPPDAWLITLGP